VISSQDHEFFHENGYLRVEDAVPTENCDAVADAIWEFMGKDPDDPGTWYTPPEGLSERFGGGNVEMYHHQSMWDVRQHPRVYQAFAELLDEERLWVSLDRCNLTPPVREERPSEGDNAFVHWDVDTSPLPTASRACSTSTTRARTRAGSSACRASTVISTGGSSASPTIGTQ